MAANHLVESLVDAAGCSRLFIDGGSNMGETVDSFLRGGFYRCAVSSPSRLYGKVYKNSSRREQLAMMQPLAQPDSWCVRSFDAAPGVAARLQASHDAARGGANKVRFVEAALGVVTDPLAPRTIVRYSNHTFGTTTGRVAHYDLHLSKPPQLDTWVHRGPSLDVRDIIRRYQRSATRIALKLDVEAHEFDILFALADEPELLCSIDYLFVEYHNLKFNTTKYGWPEDAYARVGGRILAAMDRRPLGSCRLRIHWRSFWSACGEPMRFMWMNSYQATGRNVTASGKKAARGGRRRGRRRLSHI